MRTGKKKKKEREIMFIYAKAARVDGMAQRTALWRPQMRITKKLTSDGGPTRQRSRRRDATGRPALRERRR